MIEILLSVISVFNISTRLNWEANVILESVVVGDFLQFIFNLVYFRQT